MTVDVFNYHDYADVDVQNGEGRKRKSMIVDIFDYHNYADIELQGGERERA